MHLRLITAIIFLSACAKAQDFGFINYSANNNLGAQITDICEDEFGNLWSIGLLGQFYYFDGNQPKAFTFPSEIFTNNIFRVAASSDEKVWFLTDRGLIRFDGANYDVTPLPSAMTVGYKSEMVVDKYNRVWIKDQNGTTAYINAQGFTRIDEQIGSVASLTSDKEHNLLVLLVSGKLLVIDETLNFHDILIPQLKGRDLRSLDVFKNKIVVASNDSVFVFTDNKLTSAHRIIDTSGDLQMVRADEGGNVWVLKGERVIRIAGKKQTRIDESKGLSNNRVARIFRDSADNIWILTDGKGSFKVANQPFRQFSIDEEPMVSSVFNVDDTTTMLGTYGKGMFLVEGSGRPRRIVTNSLIDRSIIISQKRLANDRYLVATHGNGLFELTVDAKDHAKGRAIKPDQPPGIVFIRSMTNGQDSILLSTRDGAFIKTKGAWSNIIQPFREGKFTVNCLYALPGQGVLVGSMTEGLLHYHDGQLTPVDTAFFKSTAVNTIQRDPYGNIWIGTNRKEIVIIDKDLKIVKYMELPLKYTGVFIIQFLHDGDVLLGVGGEFGNLLRANISPDYDVKSIVTYAASHGWPDPGFVLGAVRKYKDYIWIGTSNGAFRFDSHEVDKKVGAPHAYFTSIGLLNSSVDIHQYSVGRKGIFQLPTDTSLPYYINSLEFSFRANDIASPRSMKYRFLMGGLDADWSPWTTQTDVIFSSLSPGHYNLKVQALNDRGLTGEPVTYAFVIAPAFWQTAWFYMLLVIVIVLGLVVTNRIYYRFKLKKYLREDQLKKDEALRIKQQMSMDFHDELGNKLAGVMSYSSALRLTSKNPELSSALEYIENSAQEIFYKTKDFIWAIDVQSNNLLEVLIYLRDFGVKFFERKEIEFDIRSSFERSVFDRALPEGYNRQIILIFKEAMTNIFKHSSATQVLFESRIDNNSRAIIIIEDNGTGSLNLLTSGKGLSNMKKRATAMSAELKFEKAEPGGLRVVLEFRILEEKMKVI